MNILRLITAGSVDDGKSTLIGRLLYDSKAILADQLEAIQNSSRKNDDGTVDLAILTDGLKAEREQGITIDVAYKYFQTDKRKFIIADTPGHIQYTRNMVTGASNADLAIILIDARNGIVEQTLRHTYLISLLGIKHVVIAINKMDMVNYSEEIYLQIKNAYLELAKKLEVQDVNFIPMSALRGDNIVDKSTSMPWYEGESLIHHLENVDIAHDNTDKARLSVQYVIRPQTDDLHDYRGYAGRVLSGTFKVNDHILVEPDGISTQIARIETYDGDLAQAELGQSVTLHLKDNIDISRGNMIVGAAQKAAVSKEFEAQLCWMDTRELDTSLTYFIQHNSKVTKCKFQELVHKVNINTLEMMPADVFKLNDIGKVILKTADPLAVDTYKENKYNGGAIIIDSRSNVTVGALMFTQILD